MACLSGNKADSSERWLEDLTHATVSSVEGPTWSMAATLPRKASRIELAVSRVNNVFLYPVEKKRKKNARMDQDIVLLYDKSKMCVDGTR